MPHWGSLARELPRSGKPVEHNSAGGVEKLVSKIEFFFTEIKLAKVFRGVTLLIRQPGEVDKLLNKKYIK